MNTDETRMGRRQFFRLTPAKDHSWLVRNQEKR